MSTLGLIISWCIFGLIAGAIARLLHPGPDRMGWGSTMVLGILGSFLGGGIGYLLRLGTSPYHPASLILSIIGAIVLLALGFVGTRSRPTV
ncbi:MAG TPA: GlsB/YeaQ/YmgE family stress response membrane protein [Isosphaeraceae bacterium]|jgi:uncharacterized membrane protein YeaQ/YmgE (transglycosylase-associated protein family)|nr:GlsB/YeaQ/YmgE family stress response membrane protein [Isosphaeraceae bacterium]